MTIKSIAKIIKKGKKIAIFGHVSPDLDCLGSAFSLKEVLFAQLKKQVDIFADGKITGGDVAIFDPDQLNIIPFNYKNYDLIIVLDTPNEFRLGKYGKEVSKHDNIVKIDHHFDKENKLTDNFFIDVDSASTSEMIYLLIKELVEDISSKAATYIYAGISADTNSFLNDNVTARCMKIASEMFEKGADVMLINSAHYKSISRGQWDLTKVAYDKAEFFERFAIIGLTNKDLKKTNCAGEGTSIFANQLITIENIDIGCIITERNLRTFNCSFRSIFGVSVDVIATKLGGGGHKQASACILSGSYKEVKTKIIKTIKESLIQQGVLHD